MTTIESKEGEPKQVVFKLSMHVKEGKIDELLGELKEDLKPENTYVQAPHKEIGGEPMNTKGGRSLKVLGQLAEAKGMSIVGIKWREDISNKKSGGMDKGLGLVLEFGYGKADFTSDEQTNKWKELSRKVFEDYLWDCIYFEGGNRIGLFGSQKAVTRADGTSAINDPGKQLVLKGIDSSAGDDGMEFTWGNAKVTLPYEE